MTPRKTKTNAQERVEKKQISYEHLHIYLLYIFLYLHIYFLIFTHVSSNIFCTSANLLQISSTHLFRLSFPLENGFFQGIDVFLLKGKDLGAR